MQTSRGQTTGLSGGKDKSQDPVQEEKEEQMSGSDGSPDEEQEDEGDEIDTEISILALGHCRRHGAHYAFQIACAEVERYSIRVGTTSSGRPTCSCDERGNCEHIMWFLSQISRNRIQAVAGGQANTTPYEHITQIGLRNLCEELEWQFREGTAFPEEIQWELAKAFSRLEAARQTRSLNRERMMVVRDILATFSVVETEDFRRDIFDSLNDVTLEPIFASKDLEATVARILMRDDNFFLRFRTIVSNNIRAIAYFNKMGAKARNTLDLLDRYCEVGPVAGHRNIIWSAQTLVDIVSAISINVINRQPLNPAARSEAAKALVSILSVVARERNHDAYQNSTWPRRRPHGKQSIDRNLYERLIGSTSKFNPSGGTFVIQALLNLPEPRQFVEELGAILDLLSTVGRGHAPQEYRDNLSGLIAQLKSGPGMSSLAGKRPADSIDRNAKRMMK
ncbi:SWIM zinc finger family protein [Diplocarpon rosae]|nr:SWIM zinc finger family protein [Diplocarpon rosae]